MAKISRWRLASRAVIERVLKENPNASTKELKLLLRAAYPFGERKYHPYKIWLDEVRKALGKPPVKRRDIRHYWVDKE